ncbi:hypothetical protein [Psychroserpens sp.]
MIVFLLVAFIGLYIFFVKADRLDSELEIPLIALENQFGEFKTFND